MFRRGIGCDVRRSRASRDRCDGDNAAEFPLRHVADELANAEKGPVVLTARMRFHSSRDCFAMGEDAAIPALLTKMSTWPRFSRAVSPRA